MCKEKNSNFRIVEVNGVRSLKESDKETDSESNWKSDVKKYLVYIEK